MKCAFCGEGAAIAGDSLGELLGPVGHTSAGDAVHVHRQCALWSPEVRRPTCALCWPPSAGSIGSFHYSVNWDDS